MSNIVFGEGLAVLYETACYPTLFLYLPSPCQGGTGDSGVPQELPCDQASRETGPAYLRAALAYPAQGGRSHLRLLPMLVRSVSIQVVAYTLKYIVASTS